MQILMLRTTVDECITRKDNILRWILQKIRKEEINCRTRT